MKRIRESLEYPIPFWLSPIFILTIMILWGLFQASYKLTPDSWEFWKWIIEKLTYIGTVIGAAYWAQSIFNNNARIRENRERRLNTLIEIEKIINQIVTVGSYTSSDYKIAEQSFNKQLGLVDHISALCLLFKFNFEYEQDEIANSLRLLNDSLDKALTECYKSGSKNISDDNLNKVTTIMTNKLFDSLNKLRESVANEFESIEMTH